MWLKVRGSEAWLEAVAAGIVPTTPEAEEFLRRLEAMLAPVVLVEADIEEVVATPTGGTVLSFDKRRGKQYHVGPPTKVTPAVHEIVVAYEACGGNVSAAARALGVSRDTVRGGLRKARKGQG